MNREFFNRVALEVAPNLLGALLTVDSPEGAVTARITEVEAYHGVGTPPPYDPGSHARDRKTPRNAAMFGPPGHTYVYQNYGMHFAINLVCAPDGIASGVLLRSAEIVSGEELAASRRLAKKNLYGHSVPEVKDISDGTASKIRHLDLAKGPGNLACAIGVTRETHNSFDLFSYPFAIETPSNHPLEISQGPRVGVSGIAGSIAFPWRFWITGDKTVSRYTPGRDVPRD